MATNTLSKPTKPAKRALGRGLAALIPESDFDLLNTVARGHIAPLPVSSPQSAAPEDAPADATAPVTSTERKSAPLDEASGNEKEAAAVAVPLTDIRYLPIKEIEPNPFQPRQIFSEEELENLAASVREHGVLQPILVRPLSGGGEQKFQLIAGERRWRAATRAQLDVVPAIVRSVDDKSALELAIIENVQRHDISAIESAQAYRRLSKEFSLSQEQIAARVGKSRAAVANTMRLLDLPEDAIGALREGKISEGHGRALLTASGESARRTLLRRTLRDGLSVRELESLARNSNEADEKANEPVRLKRADPDMLRLQTTLQRALGARLTLKPRKRGGQIVIEFASPEELARLVKRMTKPEGTA